MRMLSEKKILASTAARIQVDQGQKFSENPRIYILSKILINKIVRI